MTLDAETIAALSGKCDRYRKIRARFFGEDGATASAAKVEGASSGG